jgi:hypothetical protein
MIYIATSFLFGIALGGLSVSAAWGLFWLGLASVGLARGTSGWKVVRASFMAGAIPAALLLWVVLAMDPARVETWPFVLGFVGVPVVLIGLGLRRLPDGTRVAGRLLGGVQVMMDTMLGRHHECGGCGEDHHHHEAS